MRTITLPAIGCYATFSGETAAENAGHAAAELEAAGLCSTITISHCGDLCSGLAFDLASPDHVQQARLIIEVRNWGRFRYA